MFGLISVSGLALLSYFFGWGAHSAYMQGDVFPLVIFFGGFSAVFFGFAVVLFLEIVEHMIDYFRKKGE